MSAQDWMNGSPPKLRPFQKGGASPGQVLFDGDAHPTLAAIRATRGCCCKLQGTAALD